MNTPILTVRQPWAWAIIHAGKDVENRTWSTGYRGDLLIHAGKRRPSEQDLQDFGNFVLDRRLLENLDHEGPLTLKMLRDEICVYGAIIGKVRLWGCKRQSKSSWGVGPWHWLLSDPEALPTPFYMPGKLGLWRANEAEVSP